MIKQLSAVLLSFSFAFLAPLQTSKSDREMDGLVGPVKTVRVEFSSWSDKYGKPEKEERWLSTLTSYDERGNKTEDESFYAYGKISYGKFFYLYDTAGRRTGEEKHQNGSVDRQEYTYNDKGQLIKKGNAYWVTKYIYGNKGQLIEQDRFDGDGNLSGRILLKNDDTGREVERRFYTGKGAYIGKQVTQYTVAGFVTEKLNYNGNKLSSKDTYKYDDRGNETEHAYYSKEKLSNFTTKEYEFDSQENWIKRTISIWEEQEGKSYESYYRTIIYY